MVSEDGYTYKGFFKNDQRDGQGEETIVKPNGHPKEKYIGGFKQDKRHGKGQIVKPSKIMRRNVTYDKGTLVSNK